MGLHDRKSKHLPEYNSLTRSRRIFAIWASSVAPLQRVDKRGRWCVGESRAPSNASHRTLKVCK